MIRWVETARLYPQRCAVWPQVGSTHVKGYLDTLQTTTAGERIYISVVALEHMAEGCGYVRPGDESGMFAENRRLEGRVAELEHDLAEKSGQLEAIGTLRLAGATTARPPGRPKKAVA